MSTTEDVETTESLKPQRPALLELLRGERPFSTLSAPALADLVDACELVGVPGGTYLVRAGQVIDSLYGVLQGGLRVVRRSDDGLESTVREFYRGEMVGMMGMFIERPVPVDVLVMRDSTLMRLSRVRFLALAQKHPALLQAVAELMSENVHDLLRTVTGEQRTSALPRGGNLALVAVAADAMTRATVDRLVELMLSERATARVTSAVVDRALGAGAAAGGGQSARLTEWLSNLERGTNVVLYECGVDEPAWAALSVRQSDRVVIVAAAGDQARLDEIASSLGRARVGGVPRQTDLVLVHPPTTEVPSGTRVWSRLPGISRIHHVRSGERRDLERVVRHLMGRPIGVALSGGGARGIAHLGVLAAIVEAGIPIDYICGVSMGAIFAAGLAKGWSAEQMRERVRKLFHSPIALYDPTLPVSSLLAGRKLERVMRTLYGDADIEDLWLPFFCVSTDLSRARLVVHDRGSVWKSVRASCSIPGIFPPLAMAGRSLVDGGLVDNLPLDLLAERCPGSLVAVDVFPYGDPTFSRPPGALARTLRGLRSRIKRESASPPLFDILMRSTLVGSKFRTETAMTHLKHVVYLEPPVGSFGILRWGAHRELFDAGYRYAKDFLRATDVLDVGRAFAS